MMSDLDSYAATRETLVLPKILALGEAEVCRGETIGASEVIEAIRQRLQQSVVQN